MLLEPFNKECGMELYFAVLGLIAQVILLILLYLMLNEMRRARCFLEEWLSRAYGRRRRVTILSSRFAPWLPIYAIWTWRGNSWELEIGTVPLGHVPGAPPSYPGSFQGQRVKTACAQ